MILDFDTSHHGRSTAGATLNLRYGLVHTTEGSDSSDLATLTGPDVSVHTLIPRLARKVFRLVDDHSVAWHSGWGRLRPTDPWQNFNAWCYGWEIGHRAGETWAPEHLARVLAVIRLDVDRLRIPRLLRHMDIAHDRPSVVTVDGKQYPAGGARSDPTDFPWWDAFCGLAYRPAYAIKGAPDMSRDQWVGFLQPLKRTQGDVPLEAMYATVIARGFRPGPLAALVDLESSIGTAGVAVQTRNWGNVRSPMNGARTTGTSGGWPVYRSWQEALDDVMDRLEKHPAYLPAGFDDVTSVRLVWAPVGDGANNPFAGSLKMLQQIDGWKKEVEQKGNQASTATPFGYDPAPGLLEFWQRSGGIWQADRIAPGYAISGLIQVGDHFIQRFQRATLRLRADGKVEAVRRDEADW